MARVARRNIVTSEGGFFHVLNRVAGSPTWFPFKKARVRRQWIGRLERCIRSFCVEAAGFTLMGNHFHLLVFVERFRKLAREELEEFARARWGRSWKLRTRFWSEQRWEKFNEELFRLDVFMRELQGPFAEWFNQVTGRRGGLWADRYKCVALDSFEAIQECLFYIELNPVRAHLTLYPEQWKQGSAYLRWTGRDETLISLQRLFPDVKPSYSLAQYRCGLQHRGRQPASKTDSAQESVLRPATDRFIPAGIYLNRMRFLSDGLILSTANRIRNHLKRLRQQGVYKRRKNPVPQLFGLFFTLREQRSNARF